MSATRLLSVALVACLALTTGCLRTAKSRPRVSGTVTLRGQPLADGHITFRTSGGKMVFLANVRNGSYSASTTHLVPPGEYSVAVKYTSPGRTGGPRLDQTVTRTCTLSAVGRQTVNFDLE